MTVVSELSSWPIVGLINEKQMNTEEDTFITYRRRKSRYTEEFEDIQLEDTNSDMDPTSIHSDREKGTG